MSCVPSLKARRGGLTCLQGGDPKGGGCPTVSVVGVPGVVEVRLWLNGHVSAPSHEASRDMGKKVD